MEIISLIIIFLSGFFVIFYFLLRKYKKYMPSLFILTWIAWFFISFQLSQLPVRKERIECGLFSFKVHKKYIPNKSALVGVYDAFGDESCGAAFIFVEPRTFISFDYGKIKSNNKLDTEDIKDIVNNVIKVRTEKDKAGYQEWFVSYDPFIHEMFASVDYKTSTKYRKFKKFGRDIIFIRTDDNAESYLCRLHLVRKSKWSLNRSERIFFNTLRLNSKSIDASQRGAEDDVLDLIIDEPEWIKKSLN